MVVSFSNKRHTCDTEPHSLRAANTTQWQLCCSAQKTCLAYLIKHLHQTEKTTGFLRFRANFLPGAAAHVLVLIGLGNILVTYLSI